MRDALTRRTNDVYLYRIVTDDMILHVRREVWLEGPFGNCWALECDVESSLVFYTRDPDAPPVSRLLVTKDAVGGAVTRSEARIDDWRPHRIDGGKGS